MNWLAHNYGTIICALILAGAFAGVIIKMIKDKKSGKGSCSCGCSSCGMNGACHSKK